MPSTPIRILIVAGLCVLLLAGLVVRESMARTSGTEVQMAMAGVDPRSVLSGNYVTVSLNESLPAGEPCPANTASDAWLTLRPEGRIYHVAGTSPSRAQAQGAGSLAVRGSFTCYDGTPAGDDVAASPARLTADLGVQRFYVNQADATRIGDLVQRSRDAETSPVNAILSIGQDGRARLKGLIVDGQRFELSWL